MSITKAIDINPINNTGGTIKNIGNFSEVFDSLDHGLPSEKSDTVIKENSYGSKASEFGIFSYNNPLPISQRMTKFLAGILSEVLLSGSGYPELIQSIKKIESIRTLRTSTSIRKGHYNIYSNLFDPKPANIMDIFWKIKES